MISTFVTPHNAPFATYKAARVHDAARRRGSGFTRSSSLSQLQPLGTIIGVLAPPSFTASEGLREGFHELGYVEGQNRVWNIAGRRARSSNTPTASLS